MPPCRHPRICVCLNILDMMETNIQTYTNRRIPEASENDDYDSNTLVILFVLFVVIRFFFTWGALYTRTYYHRANDTEKYLQV